MSENFEYKAAKREKNKNESRIRYLENMIKTARVIEIRSSPDAVGLYDKVTIYLEEDGEEESWQVVTTVRQDVLNGLISKESPMGAALLGKKVGERFYVQVNQDYGYYAVVRAISEGDGRRFGTVEPLLKKSEKIGKRLGWLSAIPINIFRTIFAYFMAIYAKTCDSCYAKIGPARTWTSRNWKGGSSPELKYG